MRNPLCLLLKDFKRHYQNLTSAQKRKARRQWRKARKENRKLIDLKTQRVGYHLAVSRKPPSLEKTYINLSFSELLSRYAKIEYPFRIADFKGSTKALLTEEQLAKISNDYWELLEIQGVYHTPNESKWAFNHYSWTNDYNLIESNLSFKTIVDRWFNT